MPEGLDISFVIKLLPPPLYQDTLSLICGRYFIIPPPCRYAFKAKALNKVLENNSYSVIYVIFLSKHGIKAKNTGLYLK